ncbi:hypothetical protein V2H45_12770 [Tumidithrix elongata RA019]|uniref:Type II secretion system protein GspE N-terminal domain-containing protein n=1 Tax=Tumidithrix elongata BACA0141 TaxID=2716417 RepID=A0AAW9Q334_9CYAN|nr:hypothetical protein [Tumidithrix elongata RA019]
MQLGEILVHKRLISSKQLERALAVKETTGKRLGEVLLDDRVIADSELQDSLKEQYWRQRGFWVID